jgi:hypothetical protein
MLFTLLCWYVIISRSESLGSLYSMSLPILPILLCCTNSKTCECRHCDYYDVQTAGPVSADILTTVLYKQQNQWVPIYLLLCCTNSRTCECRHTDYCAVQTSRTCDCRHTDYCDVQTARPVSADILTTVMYKQQDLWVPTYWLLCCTNSKTCECRHTDYCDVQTARPVSADILTTVMYKQQDLWVPTYWLLCCTNSRSCCL